MLRLEQLVLAGNGIGMQGGQAVAAALPKLTQLQVWGFCHRNFEAGSLKLKVTYPKDPGVSKSKGVNRDSRPIVGLGLGPSILDAYRGSLRLQLFEGSVCCLILMPRDSMVYLPCIWGV